MARERKKALSFINARSLTKVLAPLIVIWTAACVFLSLAVRATVFFAGAVASLFDPTVGKILSAWQSASITLPVPLLLLGGLVFAAWELFCFVKKRGKERRVRIALTVCAVVTGVVAAAGLYLLMLWFSRINAVPVSVIVPILKDFAGQL